MVCRVNPVSIQRSRLIDFLRVAIAEICYLLVELLKCEVVLDEDHVLKEELNVSGKNAFKYHMHDIMR